MKKILYFVGIIIYGTVMLSLLFGKYEVLILVPIIAVSWAGSMIYLLIRDWKILWNGINGTLEDETDWAAENKLNEEWIEEPKDFAWKIHTICIILWFIYWISSVSIDLIIR